MNSRKGDPWLYELLKWEFYSGKTVGRIEQPNNYDKVLKLAKNILFSKQYHEGV